MQVTNSVGEFYRTGYMQPHNKEQFEKSVDDIMEEAAKTEFEKNKNEISVKDLLAMMEKAKSKEITSLAETDWRDMTPEQWDKLVKNLDAYLDDYKAEIKQMVKMQQEAAEKAALNASPEMRSQAASRAALMVAASGHTAIEDVEVDATADPKDSWTYELDTDDPALIEKAKMSNEIAESALSKTQEMLLTNDTTEGISTTDDVVETASATENENKEKVWTITAFSQDGIVCKRGTKGNMETVWELQYEHNDDYKKVWDYLENVDKDDSFKFAGNKAFWVEFLKY